MKLYHIEHSWFKQIQSQHKLGLANDPLGRFTTFYTPFVEFFKFRIISEIRLPCLIHIYNERL
ncbi:hypothetical protein D1AOALGA4SA_1216 [Olavius algarvensis Delta 1 endosymbiont]|nr:hypothetical protein D1AOALGA4SA_1216 [Olavius algarvensis Delta 1 endosymbiont]